MQSFQALGEHEAKLPHGCLTTYPMRLGYRVAFGLQLSLAAPE